MKDATRRGGAILSRLWVIASHLTTALVPKSLR